MTASCHAWKSTKAANSTCREKSRARGVSTQSPQGPCREGGFQRHPEIGHSCRSFSTRVVFPRGSVGVRTERRGHSLRGLRNCCFMPYACFPPFRNRARRASRFAAMLWRRRQRRLRTHWSVECSENRERLGLRPQGEEARWGFL